MQGTDKNGLKVAIKVLDRSVRNVMLKRKREEEMMREIAVMKKLMHPHCVQLFEVIDDAKNDRTFLVMESPPASIRRCQTPPAARGRAAQSTFEPGPHGSFSAAAHSELVSRPGTCVAAPCSTNRTSLLE